MSLLHLNDPNTYKKFQRDPTPSLRLQINILLGQGYPTSFVKRLNSPTTCRTQQFYALPQTHRKVLKIRPIVSGRGGIFERLGWFLQCILRPLLAHVSAHITNTERLIDRFNTPGREKLKDMIPISFDVVSLYTNINTEEAINTTLHYAVKT